MKENEAHVFIVWSKGFHCRDKILDDVKTKFEILEIVDITWSKDKFSENLSRFYGENLPKNSSKEKHCGTGTFLCIIVRDKNPIYDLRETSKGMKAVNINMFDKKQLYRQWTGGGHKIHGSDSIAEARSNIYLLLGVKYDLIATYEKAASPRTHAKDLIGSNGWSSLDEIFDAFNELCNYVVLRNFVDIDQELNNLHPDIDLLTDNRRLIADISNGKPTYRDKKRVQHLVWINGQKVFFDFRFIGDNYYDYKWEQQILDSRVKYGHLYVPNALHHFYSLMYHAFVHKEKLIEDYIIKLIELSQTVNFNYDKKSFLDFEVLSDLNSFMLSNNYAFIEPRDLTVYFNTKVIEKFVDIPLSAERTSNEKVGALKALVKKGIRKMQSILRNKW